MKKKILFILALIFLAVYFYMLATVVKMQNSYSPQNSDCIIILGHSLERGGIAGDWLVRRLSVGLSLFENGFAPNIIVTGGKNQALVMRDWLLSKGVDESRVFVEDKSRNTYENLKFSMEIVNKNGFSGSIIVTNDFHMYRSMLIANDFLDSVSGSGAGVNLSLRKILAYIKEPFSILKYELYNKGASK